MGVPSRVNRSIPGGAERHSGRVLWSACWVACGAFLGVVWGQFGQATRNGWSLVKQEKGEILGQREKARKRELPWRYRERSLNGEDDGGQFSGPKLLPVRIPLFMHEIQVYPLRLELLSNYNRFEKSRFFFNFSFFFLSTFQAKSCKFVNFSNDIIINLKFLVKKD